MKVYTSCVVKDTSGNIHDVSIYTGSYEWKVRLRAVHRECMRRGINPAFAYIGGNFWSRNELLSA